MIAPSIALVAIEVAVPSEEVLVRATVAVAPLDVDDDVDVDDDDDDDDKAFGMPRSLLFCLGI
jgi:hypothetical protein